MISPRVFSAAIALLILSLLAGCSSPKPVDHSVSISASDPIELSVATQESPAASRVVAIANGSAEVIAAMGLKRILVGRDIASAMATLKSVPIVTSGHQVIAEKILSLTPDRVLIDASSGPKSAVDSLRAAHLSVAMIPEAWTLSDIEKKVSAIGKSIGAPQTAEALNAKIKSAIAAAHLDSNNHPRIAFLYLRGTSAVYLMGGPGSGTDSLIAAIGGIDVGAATLKNPFNSLTSEALVSSRPDILLVMTKGLESVGGMSGLLALPGVSQTPAGKFKRVIDVDDSLLLSFGPRTPALIGDLAKAVITVMEK
ncbi:MAG: ABC transporter substrate-binding protein [Actinobacteria bacterium]|nr:ABC transporter substrate-binding protein [Actinomycetota bacterium]